MYKYILFDADNTLLDFDKSEKQALLATFDKFEIDKAYINEFSEINKSLWELLEKNKILRDELKIKRFELLLDKIDKEDINAEEISNFYLSEIKKHSYTYDFSYYVCDKLKKMGKNLSIITNGTKTVQIPRLSKSPIRPFFEHIFISEDLGVNKPSKAFFDAVLAVIEASPNECLIVGDSLTSDILGGINSKIDTVWFNPYEKINATNIIPTYTIKELKELLKIVGE